MIWPWKSSILKSYQPWLKYCMCDLTKKKKLIKNCTHDFIFFVAMECLILPGSPQLNTNSFFTSFSSHLIFDIGFLKFNFTNFLITLSGSDHRRSQSNPWSGTSVGRIIRLICSIDWRSGLNPPWQQKIFSSTMAATGRQLKQSVKVFHNLMLYLRLPEEENYKQFIYIIIIWAGYTKYMRH